MMKSWVSEAGGTPSHPDRHHPMLFQSMIGCMYNDSPIRQQ